MKTLWTILKITAGLYIMGCAIVYFCQERFIFFPEKLDKTSPLVFPQPTEELHFKTKDGNELVGLLFPADSSKGLIFYLHGNAGSLRTWGSIAEVYRALHYDIFMLDYRGYGKSEGHISSEKQLHEDVQLVYDSLKQRYEEAQTIVLGYSIGSGLAAKLASANSPRQLILQTPYFSLSDLMSHYYPFLPRFLLKYELETNKYLPACHMPVAIIHGDQDAVIPHESSERLQKLFKPGDTLITLKGAGHNSISDHPDYVPALNAVLQK